MSNFWGALQYDPANPCHCENLIGFSLKQGWIDRLSRDEKVLLDTRRIEEEIKSIRQVIELYAHLSEPHPPEDLNHRIQELMRGQAGIIFTATKV